MAATVCYLVRTVDENGISHAEFRHFAADADVEDLATLIEAHDADAQLGHSVLKAIAGRRDLSGAELADIEARLRAEVA